MIILGANNLADDPPCTIVAGLAAVVNRVKSVWPIAQIAFLDTTRKIFLDYNDRRAEINAAMNRLPGIKTVNVDEVVTCSWTKTPGACRNYLPDNLHFAPAGYAIVAKSLGFNARDQS